MNYDEMVPYTQEGLEAALAEKTAKTFYVTTDLDEVLIYLAEKKHKFRRHFGKDPHIVTKVGVPMKAQKSKKAAAVQGTVEEGKASYVTVRGLPNARLSSSSRVTRWSAKAKV